MTKLEQDFNSSDPLLPSKDDLSRASIIETRSKEARLRAFYLKQEREQGWVFPNKTLDYLRLYQKEGSKRKDGYTEDCLHQIEPCLWLANMYEAGILPERVTYQVLNDECIDMPPHMQSIEHLFNTIHFHDVDEDFWNASRNTLEKFLRESDIGDNENTITFLGDASDAITFGHKINSIGMKERTHQGDHQIYLDAMENVWCAIAAKGPDRLGGLITRFGILEKIFTYEKQKKYLNATNRLFFHRQTLEDMERRYPELGAYFDIVNNNLSIALRCFSVILEHHPDNPEREGNPNTARIGLESYLDNAFQGAQFIPIDIAPMQRMLSGYKALASRVPVFESLVTQMDVQLSPYLKAHPMATPNFMPLNPCPINLQR